MTGKICGQCGNIISPFTGKTTPRHCMFRDIDNRWNGSIRLFDDIACSYYHERFNTPPCFTIQNDTVLPIQLELAL